MARRAETHYVPADTVVNGSKLMAICGAYVPAKQHSDTPSCAGCVHGMAARDLRTADNAIGTDAPGSPVPFVDYDPITGDELPERY